MMAKFAVNAACCFQRITIRLLDYHKGSIIFNKLNWLAAVEVARCNALKKEVCMYICIFPIRFSYYINYVFILNVGIIKLVRIWDMLGQRVLIWIVFSWPLH